MSQQIAPCRNRLHHVATDCTMLQQTECDHAADRVRPCCSKVRPCCNRQSAARWPGGFPVPQRCAMRDRACTQTHARAKAQRLPSATRRCCNAVALGRDGVVAQSCSPAARAWAQLFVNDDRMDDMALTDFLLRVRDVMGSPRPHLHRDWAHPAHICAGTGLARAVSAPGLGSPRPHLRRRLGSPPPHLLRDWRSIDSAAG